MHILSSTKDSYEMTKEHKTCQGDKFVATEYRGAPKNMHAHFNVQNICLNNLLLDHRFDFENVRRYPL
jgi:hypothetical protein